MLSLNPAIRALLGIVSLVTVLTARSDEVSVAVATNFTDAARQIAQQFEQQTDHRVILSFGSTGQLYAQITQGAPFEVFLAADQARPKRAESEGYGVLGSRFTYAIGQIVLWSNDPGRQLDADTLNQGDFQKLAIANPDTAPYGAAAVQALQKLGIYDTLLPKLVRGNNIAQVYQFVQTGNAELGFVAMAQLVHHDRGSSWIIPAEIHNPIRQDAVLLKIGAGNQAARAFLDFLQDPMAAAVIRRYGYRFKP